MEAEASSPKYADQSKLVTEYLRHLFWKRNKGFNILYQWFKDGLTQKVGFAKVFWEEVEEDVEESYRDLLPEQVAELLSDKSVEPVDQESYVEVIEGQPIELYNITVKRVSKSGKCRTLICPPEEMRVHPRSRYGEPLQFIAQEFYKTRAELDADGYDMSIVSADSGWNMEEIERAATQTPWYFDSSDGEMQRYRCAECYIKLDQDNDGIPEWRRVFMIGQSVMEDDKVDDHPFVAFCPEPMPHVFFGDCPADRAIAPQRLRTSLIRALLDNVYLSVNKRMGVIEGQVNLDDLLNSRPMGIVRMKSRDALMPLEQNGLDPSAWAMVDWAEQWREQRTGFTRYSQGLSPDSLNPTATGVDIITEKADQRMELIARHAGHSVEQLYMKMLKCVCRYSNKADEVELMGQWIAIDPREWVDGYHIHVNVGLGTGNRQKEAQVMQAALQIQAPMVGAGIVPHQAAILAARKFLESAGISSPEQYFPDAPPPAPPQPDPKIQAEQAKQQAQFQLEQQRMQMQAQVDTNRQQVEAQQQQAKMQQQMQLEREKAALQMQLEREKAAMQQQTTLETARINAESRIDAAQLQAQTTLSSQQESASDNAVN
jgi:hypothetical protein